MYSKVQEKASRLASYPVLAVGTLYILPINGYETVRNMKSLLIRRTILFCR